MTDSVSSPQSKRSAPEIREDIAHYVLKHAEEMSEITGVKKFVEEHGRLSKEISESNERQERLAEAKTEYEPIEQRVDSCRRALKNAEAELPKLFRPLGEVTFKAFVAGDIDEQPFFEDRHAIHKKVQELQEKHDSLTPEPDAGIAQKAKVKAHRLATASTIKLEKLEFRGLDKEIGRKIVEEIIDETVRCDSTTELLNQVSEKRDRIAKCSEEFEEAKIELNETAKRLSVSVGLESISSTKELIAASNFCVKSVRQNNTALHSVNRALADALQEVDSGGLPDDLVQLRESLANAPERKFSRKLKEYKDRSIEAAASAKRFWDGLTVRTRLITSGVIALSVILLGVMFFVGGSMEDRIVGQWTGEKDTLVEFRNDGSAVLIDENSPPISAKWRVLDGDSIEVSVEFFGTVRTTVIGVDFDGDEMLLTDEDNKTTRYSRIEKEEARRIKKLASGRSIFQMGNDKESAKDEKQQKLEALKEFVAEIRARQNKPIRWIAGTTSGSNRYWTKHEDRIVDVAYKFTPTDRSEFITSSYPSEILVEVEHVTFVENKNDKYGLFGSEEKAMASTVQGKVKREKLTTSWNWEDGKWVSATIGEKPRWPFVDRHFYADMELGSVDAKQFDLISIRRWSKETEREALNATKSPRTADEVRKIIDELESEKSEQDVSPSDLVRLFDDKELTDNQLKTIEKLKGRLVWWELPVRKVIRDGYGYRVETQGTMEHVKTLLHLLPRNDGERTQIEKLKEGDTIKIMGRVTGANSYSLILKPVALMN